MYSNIHISALSVVALISKLDICITFLHLHLIISVQDGLSPLYVACQNGHKLTVDVLLKNGANVNLATTVSMSLYRVFKTCMPVTLLDVHCSKYHGMVVYSNQYMYMCWGKYCV